MSGLLSGVGSQMTNFAVLLQVFRLTHDSFAVGLVGLSIAVPGVVVALLGSSVSDGVDRRTLVLLATVSQAALSGLLFWQASSGLADVSLLYVVVAVSAAVRGLSTPARRTFMANLLSQEQLGSGAAWQTLTMHLSLTAGPALAGVLTALVGLQSCYLVDSVSFLFALYAVARLPRMRPEGARRPGWTATREGFSFVWSDRPILGALLADASATVFGMPVALFPAIDAARFSGNPETLGLMTTALAVGGVIGSILSGPTGRALKRGRGMLIAGAVWGGGLVGFGLAHVFWLVFMTLVVAGVGDVTAVVFRTALIQERTPDELRGRVSAAEHAVGAGVPQLGNFRAGLVASVTSPGLSAVGGGLGVIFAAGLIALVLPAFRESRSPAATAVVTTRSGEDAPPTVEA